ncbi:hypothetical protein [Mycobacterium sp. 1274761.0]|uniref:hypothetical protein n=1 Tax=Mycobacterium sp. 1274761.0 TaxID=1834077 RepID=UPI00080193F5|nr:hypothetical protein [Mycobacterium sp. 1274761.0]OBK70341.1 hypothetical protein A5651_22545 [Mycobacterium sp. 1274761.0]
MVTVPAPVWRYGPALRGLILGVGVGGFLAILAWLDSGFLLATVIVFVMLSVSSGVWMSRRMARYWPSAASLSGSERERVVAAARNGHAVDDARLSPALGEYRDGLHTAAEEARPLRWLFWFVLVVAIASAVWDATFGSWGNTVASAVYLALLVLDMFWWPRRQRQLLANADRAVEISRDREPEGK